MAKIALMLTALFVASNSNGMAAPSISSLEALRWEHRLIIGKIVDRSAADDFLRKWKHEQPALLDRKLALILIAEDGLQTADLKQSINPDSNIKDEIIRKLKDRDFALIGLDGGVKSRYTLKDFSFESIFGQIDQMPMRAAELRNRPE